MPVNKRRVRVKHKEVRPGWGVEGEKLLKKVSVVLWSSQAGVVRQFRMITNRTAIVPSFA